MFNEIKFVEDWQPPHLYSEEQISQLEQEIGAQFPDVFRQYMQTRGTQKIDSDVTYCIVDLNGFLDLFQYDNFVHQAFFNSHYRKYREKSDSYEFDLEKEKYFPFSQLNQTGVTKQGVFRLFISLNEQNYGTIWVGHDLYYEKTKEIYFVADSFSSFLESLAADRIRSRADFLASMTSGKKSYKEIVKENNDSLFYRWLDDYEQTTTINFLQFNSLQEFADTLLNNSQDISLNPLRKVKFGYYRSGAQSHYRKQDELFGAIKRFSEHQPEFNHFSSITDIKPLQEYTFPMGVDGHHDFYSCWVEGVLNNGMKCEEEFVFYKDPLTHSLSFIAINATRYESVKVKGLGTFDYDGISWKMARKKKPKWSNVPCSVTINDGNDLFDTENCLFMTEFFNQEELRGDFETFVYQQYQTIDYPEYLAGDQEEQEEYRECYPNISSKEEIWQLLGESMRIHVDTTKKSISIYSDYLPDDEHGITIEVREGVILM